MDDPENIVAQNSKYIFIERHRDNSILGEQWSNIGAYQHNLTMTSVMMKG